MVKKLTLTSLVASACLFSNVYAENTLEEAFQNGKVKGEVRSYYFQESNDGKGQASILHFGGFLNYETAAFYGVTTGVTFQASSVGDIDYSEGNNVFVDDEDASGAVMSEAFITYTRKNSSIKAGRQFIGTPLLAGSGSRMIRQAFQGYTFVNTDLPQSKIVAAYVDRFQSRTDGEGNPGEFTKNFNTNAPFAAGVSGNDPVTLEDGAYSVYLENKSVDNLTIQAQYLDAIDVFVSTYADAKYNFATSGNIYAMGQYIGTSYDASYSNGTFFAVRVGGAYDKFNFKLSASDNSSNGNVQSGLGYGADYSLTGSEIAGGYYSYQSDTTAYQVNVGTNIAKVDLNLIYTTNEIKNANDVKETNIIASYDLVKNLNLNVLYADFDGASKDYETRVKLTYKF